MKKHYGSKICAYKNNPATKKEIGYANLVQQQMDKLKSENKENARFIVNQLIENQDETKNLWAELE